MNEMERSNHLYIPADKTTNIYKVSMDQYRQLSHSDINANYKKADAEAQAEINREAEIIAKELYLEDRVECLAQRDAFITLKDHKENFINNTKYRLLNPANSQNGLISKQLLEDITSAVKLKLQINQWR